MRHQIELAAEQLINRDDRFPMYIAHLIGADVEASEMLDANASAVCTFYSGRDRINGTANCDETIREGCNVLCNHTEAALDVCPAHSLQQFEVIVPLKVLV